MVAAACGSRDPAADKVFRIDPDGTDIASVSVSDAVDLDVAGDTVVVARFYDRVLALIDGSMKVVQTISVPWNALRLDPAGDGGAGSLSGIVVAPSGGIYVSNETGATADKRSTYGIADDRRGTIDGVDYTDITEADRDPVLRAVSNVLANDTDADGTRWWRIRDATRARRGDAGTRTATSRMCPTQASWARIPSRIGPAMARSSARQQP